MNFTPAVFRRSKDLEPLLVRIIQKIGGKVLRINWNSVNSRLICYTSTPDAKLYRGSALQSEWGLRDDVCRRVLIRHKVSRFESIYAAEVRCSIGRRKKFVTDLH